MNRQGEETLRKNTWYTDLTDQIEGNKHIITEFFNLAFTRQIIKEVVKPLAEDYFRPEFIGFDHFPERNNPDVPLIFASNHSGMAFPWDAIILASEVYEMFGYNQKSIRPLASPMLSESILMNPFLHKNLWKTVGSVDASFLNFETMLHQKEHNLLIYPEGVPGIGKGFNRRYQLQRFSSSFITMSIKYRTDVVPVFTVNGEYINPYAYRVDWINQLANRFGVPYIPVGPVSMLLPFQPWVFYSALPAKLIYVLGKTIRPYEMTSTPLEEMEMKELVKIKEIVKAEMQEQLHNAVRDYGETPYKIGEFFSVTFKNIRKFPYNFPFGWPLVFSAFIRAWNKGEGKHQSLKLGFLSTIRILLQRPFNIWYFIPIIGWIPILIRGVLKKDMKN